MERKPDFLDKQHFGMDDLVAIMQHLRGEGGCAWDRAQTHESIRKHVLEEAYEVIDAIESGRPDRLCDELGDLLMQVVFHERIAREAGEFDMEDVTTGICRKLISRHTHVFGEDVAGTPDAVIDNWEKNKKIEKGLQNHADVLDDVPRTLPALMRSYKVQQKARQAGFDWSDIAPVEEKVREELEEIREARQAGGADQADRIADEVGDLLFAVVNYARFLDVQPEMALQRTTERFIRRFRHVEASADAAGRRLEDMSLEEMDRFWEQAKETGL